jgi:hypothetical protein
VSGLRWAELGRSISGGPVLAILILAEDLTAGGCSLRSYDRNGHEIGETWHQSAKAARAWADSEYGGEVRPWAEIPDSTPDPVAYALRRRR